MKKTESGMLDSAEALKIEIRKLDKVETTSLTRPDDHS